MSNVQVYNDMNANQLMAMMGGGQQQQQEEMLVSGLLLEQLYMMQLLNKF